MGYGKRIRGEGPSPCRYMVIGEYPEKRDAVTGRVYSGKVGRELERYFDGTKLPNRDDVRVTTWIREWCGPDLDYVAEDYDRDEAELTSEIRRVQPRLIVALGRSVVRYFLGDVDLDETFGIAWALPDDSPARALFDDASSVVVFAAYGPGAGFRSPDISARIAYQFAQLEGVVTGAIPARVLYDDPIPEPIYEELIDPDRLDEVMNVATLISADSEGYAWAPWSVQITTTPGHAYILRYKNRELLVRFAEWVHDCRDRLRFVFHSALHDLAVFRSVGIDTRELQFDDTMIMSYNLQLEPQGLKPLCARFCGMKMDHFDEVMGDASFRLAQDWLLMVEEMEDGEHKERCQAEYVRLTTTPYTDGRGKLQPGRRLKVAPKLPRTDLHKAIERCLRSATPRKLWSDQIPDRHAEAAPRYGPIWEATLDHIPLDRAIRYAGRDSDGTHRLRPELVRRLDANQLWPVYQADLATVPLIDRMQQIGIRPDLEHFARLSTDLAVELVEIRARLAGRLVARGEAVASAEAFNPNSTYHVGELLYEKFQCDVLKRTPGGDPSTNDKILEALEKDARLDRTVRDIVADIREYREIYKLKHTFTDQIPDFVHRWPHDGRIHSTFRITRVVTGRLAASDPNLLAMPKHGKFATRFREGFVSRDGAVLASWDLSQIELRVLAHLSQDPTLLHAFRTGLDLHATLAERIFGVKPKDQDKSKHRLPAKAVNFGIPMGMTNVGLCIELRKNGVDVNEDDAQRWLTETMKLYAEVPVYQQGKIAEAKRYGFVCDLRGRRRYVGGIRSWDDAVRSEAERFAFATPIQAGAQSIMKRAEAYLYTDILLPRWKRGDQVEPLIQIHDDLLLELDEKLLTEIDEEMVYAMTQVPADDLSVPIETSGDYGVNWGKMKAIREEVAA